MNNVETEPKEIIDESKSQKIIEQLNETPEVRIAKLEEKLAKTDVKIGVLEMTLAEMKEQLETMHVLYKKPLDQKKS